MITTRAAALGIVLSILIAVLVQSVELYTAGQYISSSIPAPGPIALFLVVTLILSPIPRLLGRRWAFEEGELRLVYAMMLVAGPIATATGITAMPYAIMGPYQHATVENKWPELLWPHIPKVFQSSQERAAEFFMGGSETGVPWGIWCTPLVVYGLFFVLLYGLFVAIASLLRREWEDHEKLPYPLAQIPIVLSQGRSQGMLPTILRSPLFWIAFFVPLLVGSLTALHAMIPQVPAVQTRDLSLGPLFNEPPWDILGMYRLSIGIAFTPLAVACLVPQEVSLSVWFFFLFSACILVFGKATGLSEGGFGGFPYFAEQGDGAMLGVFLTTIWLARKHLMDVGRSVIGRGERLRDEQEPLPYGAAAALLITSVAGLIVWKIWLGAGPVPAALSILFLIAMSTAVARIRAEVGLGVPGDFPDFVTVATRLTGSIALSAETRITEAYTWFIGSAHRTQPLPVLMEGVRVAGGDRRKALAVMLWSVIISAVASVGLGWVMIYTFGADSLDWIHQRAGSVPFGGLVDTLRTPKPPDGVAALFMGVGTLAYIAIGVLRTRLAAWPFHPLGFLIALDTWEMNGIWFSVLLGWLIRRVVGRYAGQRGYRMLAVAAIGLIAGDAAARVVWPTLAVLIGRGYTPV